MKWTNLPYDCCTWEAEDEGVLLRVEHVGLFLDLWGRVGRVGRVREPEASKGPIADLPEQPRWGCLGSRAAFRV